MQGEIISEHIRCPDKKLIDEKLLAVFKKWTGQPSERLSDIMYKVSFEKAASGSLVDCLIEVKCNEQDQWFARAVGSNSEKSFTRAIGSLHALVSELNELRNTSLPASLREELNAA